MGQYPTFELGEKGPNTLMKFKKAVYIKKNSGLSIEPLPWKTLSSKKQGRHSNENSSPS